MANTNDQASKPKLTLQELAATPEIFNRTPHGQYPELGPLQTLVDGNSWVGNVGFNLMVVPNPNPANPDGFIVMISQLFETHVFEPVPAPTPNRSLFGTAQIGAVKYSQTVAENTSKKILHEETGMWMNQNVGILQADGTYKPDPTNNGLGPVTDNGLIADLVTNPIVRSGTIPHGNTVHATGVWTTFTPPANPGVFNPDVSNFIELANFQNDGNYLKFLPIFAPDSEPSDPGYLVDLQAKYMNQIAASLQRIKRTDLSVAQFINPIGFLNAYADNIVGLVSMAVTTANADGGGVLNVPFESAVVAPQNFISTFLIETILNTDFPTTDPTNDPNDEGPGQDELPVSSQLQYIQSIPLLFPKFYTGADGIARDVIFPHWNVNTLSAI
jgi:hypothetical protein